MENAVKLLLVEDDDSTRNILAAVIARKFKNLKVATAINGQEALEIFRAQMPEIIMTDVNMPVMDGLQLAREIRAIKAETTIIVITADTGKTKLEAMIGKEVKIDHYILKPIDYNKLFSAIEQSLLSLQ